MQHLPCITRYSETSLIRRSIGTIKIKEVFRRMGGRGGANRDIYTYGLEKWQLVDTTIMCESQHVEYVLSGVAWGISYMDKLWKNDTPKYRISLSQICKVFLCVCVGGTNLRLTSTSSGNICCTWSNLIFWGNA